MLRVAIADVSNGPLHVFDFFGHGQDCRLTVPQGNLAATFAIIAQCRQHKHHGIYTVVSPSYSGQAGTG